ncbi:MAG: TolC family protein [Verrucomicrobia bacterium]|nr:TolC family protein [Verrucomicrobiota bacterium]
MGPRLLLALGAVVGGLSSPAAEPAPAVVTPALVQGYVEWARTNNPGLQAAQSRSESARLAIGAIKKWEDPVAKVGGAGATPRGLKLREDGDLIYGAEQRLPLFGKYAARADVAAQEWSLAQKTADYQFQMLRREVAKTLFRAALSAGRIQGAQEDLAQLETWASVAEQRYSAGGGSQIEVLRLRSEGSKLREALQTRRLQLRQEQASLNRILARDPQAPLPELSLPEVFPDLPYSAALADIAVRYEPRLQLLHQETVIAESRVSLARAETKPEVAVGVEGRHYSGDAGLRGGSIMLAMSLPWFNGDKNRKSIGKEKARVEAARLESADYQLAIREEVHRLTTMANTARREALLYQDEIVPRAQLIVQTASSAWRAGRGQFAELMEGRRMLVEARQLRLQAIADQFLSLSELLLCCGLSDLEALDIFRDASPSTPSQPKP